MRDYNFKKHSIDEFGLITAESTNLILKIDTKSMRFVITDIKDGRRQWCPFSALHNIQIVCFAYGFHI